MAETFDGPVEYQGHYIVKDMIQPTTFERSNATPAENTRFGISKMVDGERKTINYAMTEETARDKIDALVGAGLKRDEQALRRVKRGN